jgi:hypothetical protein
VSHASGAVARSILGLLALTAPVLALGQAAPADQGAVITPPVQAVPGIGGPAGAQLPDGVGAGAMVPGANLSPEPVQFTRYGVAAGLGETDNVNVSQSDPKAQTIAAANLDFDVKRSGSRLDLTGLGVFTDLEYLQGAFSNQVLGRFDGLANAKLWADHLNWVVADDYGEQQTTPFAALSPQSLQRVNIFSTGPDLTLRPSYQTFVHVDARYTGADYQTSPFDGHNLLGGLEVGRQPSALSQLSLAVELEELRFDNTLVNTNYDRRAVYGHYRIQGARTAVDVRLGATQANDTESWKTSPLARLLLTRRISPFSVVTLSGGREYSDSSQSFSDLRSGAAGGIVVAPVSQTTANYQRTYGSAGWAFTKLRTGLELTGNWEHDSYDLQNVFDAERLDLALRAQRSITPALTANLVGSVDHYRYLNEAFTDKFGTVGAGLSYRLGRWTVVYARYDHAFRRSSGTPSTTLIGATTYDENRVFVMIGYRPYSDDMSSGGGPAGLGGSGPSY